MLLLCLTLWDPTDCSMPGLPVPHHLPKFDQVRVHCIGDTIQPSHPLTPQSFLASGTFSMNHLFTSDDQNTGASASASVLPVTIQGWFPLRLTGLISLLSKGLSGVFSSSKASILWCSSFFTVQFSQLYVTTGTIALTIRAFVGRVMSLLFKTR